MIEHLKVNMKVFIFAFVFFLVISLVSAQSDNVVIKQKAPYDLKRACFHNGTYCGDGAVCTLTIIKQPDGVPIINNITMTNQQTFHNVTLTTTQTSFLGTHDGIMSCTDGGPSGQDTFDVLITPSGEDDDSIRNLILLGFGFLFSIGIIFFGFNREDPWVIMLGSFGLFVFGLYTLLNGVGNYRNTMTEWTSFIILGIAGYVSVRTGMEVMDVL